MRKSFGLVWLLLPALALAGCKKEQAKSKAPEPVEPVGTSGAQESGGSKAPVQPDGEPAGIRTAGSTPSSAGSVDEARALLAALDRSGDNLLGAAMRSAGKASMSGTDEDSVPSAGADEDEPMPFDRMQALADLTRIRGTPIGEVLQLIINAAQAEDDENMACVFGLVGKLDSLFLDMSFDAAGEPKGILLSARLALSQTELLACMRTTLDAGETVSEVQIGGRTAWTKEPVEGLQSFLVEAEAGRWMMGTRAALEAALAAGTDPAADANFAAYAQALGDGALKIALIANDQLRNSAGDLGELPPQGLCLAAAMRRIQGIGVGLNLTNGLGASLAIRNASTTEAGETHRCISALWELFKPLMAEALQAEAGELLEPLGLTPNQILDLPQMDAAGEFARLRVQFPESVLGAIMQMAMSGGF